MAGNCQKLKFNRRKMRMTQYDFAKMIGVDVKTIDKLERDEDAWDVLPEDIADRIYSHYGSMASYQPSKEEVKEMLQEEKKKKPEKNRGPRCERLIAKRTEMGLTQTQLAATVGVHFTTINKLENDETAWTTIKSETADKIMKFYDSSVSNDQNSSEEPTWESTPERKKVGNWSDSLIVGEDGSVKVDEDYIAEKKETKSDLVEIVEDPKALEPIPELMIKHIVGECGNLTDKDRQLLKYVEFACDQLREAKSHEDFETNIDILTRIIKKQY